MVTGKELIYPELSYKIIGCAYSVHNELGGGRKESAYQNALFKALIDAKLKVKQQVYYPIRYKGSLVGKDYLDFLIDECIVVEIKRGHRYPRSYINQVVDYLKESKLQLALLINFGDEQVVFKRIVVSNL